MNRFRHAALLLVVMSALVKADTALLALVQPDVKAVGGINVTQTRNSTFGQFLLSQMKADDAGFRQFVEATGFDPRNDLSYIVFASPADPGTKRGVVIARGVFNGPQIFAAAKAKGATTITHEGVEMLQNGGALVAILDGQLAIAGDEALVKAALARRSVSGLSAPLLRKASDMSSRYHSWMVTSGMNTRLPQIGGRPGAPNPAFESILETSGGVNFGTVIQVEGEAVTKTDADAKALVQIAQFLTGMIALNQNKTPQAEQIQNILQTLEISAQGATVKMSLRLSQADLESIIKAPKRTARRSAQL